MKKFFGLCFVVAALVASGTARAEGYPNYSSSQYGQYGMQSGYSQHSPMNSFSQPYGQTFPQTYQPQQSYPQSYGMNQYPSQYQNQGYRQCRNQRTGMPQQCRRPRRRASFQQGCGNQGGGCGQQGYGNEFAGYGGGFGGQGFGGGGMGSGFSMSLSFGSGGGGCSMF